MPLSITQRSLLFKHGVPPLKWIQEEVVSTLLAKRDCLALLPTGTGKSLCFQAPALILNKPVLVISPLLALMQDQVDQLTKRGILAAQWTSLTSPENETQILRDLETNSLRLLYLSPEKLSALRVLERIKKVNWGVLAIDEAHCVANWGESFRPLYQSLGRVFQVLDPQRKAVRFACTATATEVTTQKICQSLSLHAPKIIALPNIRPNLHLAIARPPSDQAARSLLFRLLQQWWMNGTGTALVYVSSRLSSQSIAHQLQQSGLPAQYFHAGLNRDEKQKRLAFFCSGQRCIFVATCALGMGVDMPSVRLVIHAESPLTLESYAQEVGRAGRDGQPAKGIWIYRRAQLLDTVLQRQKKDPKLKEKIRSDARLMLHLAEKQWCISQTLQDAFACEALPQSSLWRCGCSRCSQWSWRHGD